jgi:hypothetical protein
VSQEWEQFVIFLPRESGDELIKALERMGFTEDDACALNRPGDGAHANYAPIPHPGHRPYRWEPFE